MRVAIPKEIHPGERRVAATPQTVMRLSKLGFSVTVESGAGLEIHSSDAAYQEAGAEIVSDARAVWAGARVVLKVRPPEEHGVLGLHEGDLLTQGGALICFLWPAQNRSLLE